MSLNLNEKKAVVEAVAEVAKSSNAVVGASYIGISAEKMTELRALARAQGVHLRIVKNTLAKRALADTEFASCEDRLVGPLMLAFSTDEPSAGARIFKHFIKENATAKEMVQFLWFDGEVYAGESLDKIASMPTKDEAIAMLMSVMKAPVAKLARTIDAVKAQKEAEAA
ncbi:50S ribosomal protein L10 [Ostreibacterium oceani]|uniref:Large ribosomal subunit protein uL10 n=1 Tax=Ostreibacterium oceani TaxID=2654998 RepID=A0A6N7EZP8_9GAMM|nr:50S ribosomal protein L10 [Ostreibacterium oceani]MPV86995.1 50S ribosomal protein L10 [Ostreibacterium oceani]